MFAGVPGVRQGEHWVWGSNGSRGGMRAEIGRVASLLVALACLAATYFLGNRDAFHLVVTVVVIPLGCVWYGDEIGDLVGMSTNEERGASNIIGMLVSLAGWVALFALLAAIVYFGHGSP